MTDFSSSDDELLSSFIDGDLTDGDVARLQARLREEPALRARHAAMREAVAVASAPVTPLSKEQADSLIAAALAASETAPNVTDLGAARAARARWVPKVAAAAAAVVLLAIAVPVLGSLDGDDDETVSLDSAGDSSIADAGADDTADDTDSAGGDGDDAMAEADMVAPADDMADDTTSTGDGDLDMADAPDEDDSAADDEGQPSLEAVAANSFSEVFGNDALEEELGAFGSTVELRDAVEAGYDAFSARGLAPPDDVPAADTDRSFERILDAGLGDCIDLLVELEARDSPVVAVDYSTAAIGPATVAIVLYALEDGGAVIHIIDPIGCVAEDEVRIDAAG